MNIFLAIPTDIASLSVFDSAVVRGYEGGDLESFDPADVEGVRAGLFFGFSTGRDGVFRVRITDDDLSSDEREFAVAMLADLGLRCRSGSVRISGVGFDAETPELPTTRMEPGEYRATVYEILWTASQAFFSETGEPLPDRPADYVVQLAPAPAGSGAYRLPEVALRLETVYLPSVDGEPAFLFPHEGRRLGTPPGTVLISTVILSRTSPSGLCLKACGVEGYPVDLDDYSGLKWKDRVRFEVLGVDPRAGRFQGRFLAKVL